MNYLKLRLLPFRITSAAVMNRSVYFDNVRVTRSKVMTTEVKKEIHASSPLKNGKQSKTKTESLAQKLKKRKAAHVKVENYDLDDTKDRSIKLEAENSVEEATRGSKSVKWEPPVWKDQLDNIYEMRKNWDAPVDSMGCDVISDATSSPEVWIT